MTVAEGVLTRRQSLAIFLAAASFPSQALSQPVGKFRGRVVAEWISVGAHRQMKLTEPFAFVDVQGRYWSVPSGVVVDGASIPQFFWSLIGSPFEGPYRQASVIHDRFCDIRTRSYADVHKMFYEAMLAGSVGPKKAWIMYQAVARFGPTWPEPRIDPRCQTVGEDYDFDFCAQNTARPAITMPTATRSELLQFITEVEPQADPTDVATLKREVEKI